MNRTAAGSTRQSAATRICSPISYAGCWRTAPTRRSSTVLARRAPADRRLSPTWSLELGRLKEKPHLNIPCCRANSYRPGRRELRRARSHRIACSPSCAMGLGGGAGRGAGLQKPTVGGSGRKPPAIGEPVLDPALIGAGEIWQRSFRGRGCAAAEAAPLTPRRAPAPAWDRTPVHPSAPRSSTAPPVSSGGAATAMRWICAGSSAKADGTILAALSGAREAADYPALATPSALQRRFSPSPGALPGPTGERNRDHAVRPRGLSARISPWYRLSAIFTGQIAAAFLCRQRGRRSPSWSSRPCSPRLRRRSVILSPARRSRRRALHLLPAASGELTAAASTADPRSPRVALPARPTRRARSTPPGASASAHRADRAADRRDRRAERDDRRSPGASLNRSSPTFGYLPSDSAGAVARRCVCSYVQDYRAGRLLRRWLAGATRKYLSIGGLGAARHRYRPG